MSALLRAAAIATAALAQVPVPLQPEARPAVAIGQVTDAASGRGVRQAILRLAGAGETLTRVADERGRFLFRGLPAGCVREGTGAGRARPPGRTSEKRRSVR